MKSTGTKYHADKKETVNRHNIVLDISDGHFT